MPSLPDSFLALIVAWAQAHPAIALAAVGAVAFFESLAVIGLVMPGALLLFAAGALVTLGGFPFLPVYAIAVAGAVVGDAASYVAGRRLANRARGVWPFSRHPVLLDRGLDFFARHGGKGVAIGRFFGPVRGIMPFVAGMAGMGSGRFVVVDVPSALVWAPAYLLPGMVFGASLALAAEVAGKLVVLLVALVVLVWCVIWLARTVFNVFQPRATRMLDFIVHMTVDRRVLGELSAALADPAHPEARGLVMLALILIAGAWGFAEILSRVIAAPPDTGINQAVQAWAASFVTPWGLTLMRGLTRLGDPVTMGLVGAGVTAVLIARRAGSALAHWCAALAFAGLAGALLKQVLQVPRPNGLTELTGTYAFPSGHVLHATVIYGFLAVLVAGALPVARRWWPYTVAALLVTLIAVSRLYLGVHWLTDIVGSAALGLAWVCVLGIGWSRHRGDRLGWGALAVAGLVSMGVALPFDERFDRAGALAGARSVPVTPLATPWRAGGFRELPAERSGIGGPHPQPFNVQWRGDPVALVERFVAAGCVQPGQISLRDLMTTLHASASVDELPLLPSVWDGRHEDLRLACPAIAGRRFVLRLWESGHTDPEDGRRLWLGAAGFVEAVHTGAGFSHVTGVADDGTATDVFIRHAGTLVLARVQRETGVERILAGE